MGSGFLLHLLIVSSVIVLIGLWFWMHVRVLLRAGFSSFWVLATLVPVFNVVMLWVFAFSRWPNLDRPDVREVFD